MAVGGKLREVHLVELTETGLNFHAALTRERCLDLLRSLKAMRTLGLVCLADSIKAMEGWHGAEFVQESLAALEFDEVDATRAIGIGMLADGVRHRELSDEHYWVLTKARLEPAEQQRWSALAVKHGLSAGSLARSIAAGEVRKEAGCGGGRASTVTIHAVRQYFDTWWSRAQNDEPIATMDVEHARALWNELEAPTRVGAQLAARLGISL